MENNGGVFYFKCCFVCFCRADDAIRRGSPSQSDKVPSVPTLAIEKAPDQFAKEEGLNVWKKLLSSTQEKTDDFFSGAPTTRRLKMEIENPDVWNNAFKQALAGKSTTPLKVRWVATEAMEDPRYGAEGSKSIGEAEFNNITVALMPEPLNDVDKANGIQWSGVVEVDFLSRVHSVSSDSSTGWVKDKDAFLRWIADPNPDQPFPQFSPFERDGWFTKFQLKNGQWIRHPQSSPKANVSVRYFELPTERLASCSDYRACIAVKPNIQ